MYKCVLFDMDGTLVNTYRGIFNSYKYAFHKIGREFPGKKFVGKAIGAPLLSVFQEELGLSKESAEQAVIYYREYYSEFGKNEAELYDGIEESLEKLKAQGIYLGVATLKREIFAKEILNDLNLMQYFDSVCGIDEKDKLTKSDLLKKCMNQLEVLPSETLLVGDSEYDAEGAEDTEVAFMAVLYGFGFRDMENLKKYKVNLYAENGKEIAEKSYVNGEIARKPQDEII